jgi:hypothetical protein
MSEHEPTLPIEPSPIVVNPTVMERAERNRQRIERLQAAIAKAKAEGRARPDLEAELVTRQVADAPAAAGAAEQPYVTTKRLAGRIGRLRDALGGGQADPDGSLQRELERLEREQREREGR